MHCDADMLWTLVEQDDEPGDQAAAIVDHLEWCDHCREKLADLAGGPHWWEDAKHWLSNVESGEPADHLPPLPVDLSFLEDPAHPEMLGRIGRYDVEALIGRGGMGVVLRAYDSDLHRSVAIKVMAPEWAASIAARRRFAREAQAAASVAHENVVPIYNVEAEAKQPFLVMQYVPGTTLQSWVTSNGPPDVATILRVAGQLAEGLSAAHHRGLVHRDVKPGNVLVGKNIDRVWITDFGLARAADSMTLTRTGVIAGTPHYMSPEQARGEAIDHRSDLFSLGCVLYFLAAGKPPFDAENTLAVLHKLVTEKPLPLTEHRRDLPPSFVSLVNQLLTRSRVKRPADCDAVVAKLAVAQDEFQTGKVARPPATRGTRIAGFAAATLAIVALTIGAISFASKYRNQTIKRTELSASAPLPNTFDNVSAADSVDPYIVQASQQIDAAVAIDDLRFQKQVQAIDQEIQQLDRLPFDIGIPFMTADEASWRQEVEALLSQINKQRL